MASSRAEVSLTMAPATKQLAQFFPIVFVTFIIQFAVAVPKYLLLPGSIELTASCTFSNYEECDNI